MYAFTTKTNVILIFTFLSYDDQLLETGGNRSSTNKGSMPMSLLSSLEDTYLTFGDKDTNQKIMHSVTKLTGVNYDLTTHINTNRNDDTKLYDDIIMQAIHHCKQLQLPQYQPQSEVAQHSTHSKKLITF